MSAAGNARRKLAAKISAFVVRRASPGCKEWAEGLAREMDFIASDWSALWWAIGSLRVLLDYREAPISSLDEVPATAARFMELARRSICPLWFLIMQGPLYVWKFFRAKNSPGHTGCALVVIDSIAAGIFLLIEYRRPREPTNDEITVWAMFYKKELEHRWWSQLIASGFIFCWMAGVTLSRWNEFPFSLVLGALDGLLFLAASPLFVHGLRTNRRRIEQLDELMVKSR